MFFILTIPNNVTMSTLSNLSNLSGLLGHGHATGAVSIAVLAVLAVLTAGIYGLRQVGRRDARLPPSPPTIAILGNAHFIPKTGVTFIVLSDPQIVDQLLDKDGVLPSTGTARPTSWQCTLSMATISRFSCNAPRGN